MNNIEIQNKIQLTKHAISLEKDPNKLQTLQKDKEVLELRIQINNIKEKIKNLQNNEKV
jgi:hypothetical protein